MSITTPPICEYYSTSAGKCKRFLQKYFIAIYKEKHLYIGRNVPKNFFKKDDFFLKKPIPHREIDPFSILSHPFVSGMDSFQDDDALLKEVPTESKPLARFLSNWPTVAIP